MTTIDVALAVEALLPAANYSGSVTANTEAAWNAVVWGENYERNQDGTLKLDEDGKPILMPKPTWEALEEAWVALSNAAAVKERLSAIDARLAELDAASMRPLRAIVDGSATDFDKNKLKELESQAEALRQELSEIS